MATLLETGAFRQLEGTFPRAELVESTYPNTTPAFPISLPHGDQCDGVCSTAGNEDKGRSHTEGDQFRWNPLQCPESLRNRMTCPGQTLVKTVEARRDEKY